MTETERRLVEKMLDNGLAVESIMQLLPYEKKVARKMILDEFPNANTNKLSTKELVLYAYENVTKNPYEIAEIYGFKVDRVKTILDGASLKRKRPEHNYKKRKPPQISRLCEKTQNILEALKDGYSPARVAQMYEVSRQHVYKIKAKYYKE